jgi:membrane-bound serine protease (ClpP class)
MKHMTRGIIHIVILGAVLTVLVVGRSTAAQEEQEAPATAQPAPERAEPGADTAAPAAPAPPAAAPDPSRAALVVLRGDINDYNRQQIERRFALARETGAGTIIFEIDTYGGLVDTGLTISRFIKRQHDLHVVAYIPQKAISAGAMIAVACDEIVMEPGALIGNSGVVTGTGQELSGTMRAKAESMVIEEFYDSAVRNNHEPLLLEAMVVVERTVHWVEHKETGERRFVETAAYERLLETEQWQPVPGVRDPLDREDTLLTLGTDLAVKVGLATEAPTSLNAFLASRGLELVGEFAPTGGDSVIAFLNSFAVRGILMTVLMLSLYMSLSSPGQGLPEAVAICALAALLGVPLLTGYATWYEILAVLIGLALIALEIFVFPGFGIAGISGILLMMAGLVMTFVPPIELPDVPLGFAVPWGMLQQGLLVVFISLLCSLLLWAWLVRFLPYTPRLNRLILTAVVGGGPEGGPIVADIPSPTQTVAWPTRGARGKAVTDLRPGGSAEFYDEALGDSRIIDVYSDSGFIRAGSDVIVRRVQGAMVLVKSA